MTRPKNPLRVPAFAAAVLLGGSPVFAQDRTGDAGLSGPVVAPTVNAGPQSRPGFGSGLNVPNSSLPNAGLNAGVGVSGASGVSAAPPAGAAAIGAPSAAEMSAKAAQLENAAAAAPGAAAAFGLQPGAADAAPGSVSLSGRGRGSSRGASADPGAALMAPRDEKAGARALSGRGALDSAVSRLGQARALEDAGLSGATGQSLSQIFDAEGKTSTRVGDRPGGAVAGKTTRLREQVGQTVKIADSASAHDAPARRARSASPRTPRSRS